jgi:hypothetical protein
MLLSIHFLTLINFLMDAHALSRKDGGDTALAFGILYLWARQDIRAVSLPSCEIALWHALGSFLARTSA